MYNLVEHGSEDYKGRIADKRKIGSWKSCWPMLAYTAIYALILSAIYGNIITYMTTVLHRRTAVSARDVNNLQGVLSIMGLVGAFISDTYLGRYRTISLTSGVLFLGMMLLTISVSVESLRPLPCQNGACTQATSLQMGIFFLALYSVAVGCGSVISCIVSFGADQFDEEDVMEKRGMASFFNYTSWCFSLGGIVSMTALVYVEDRLSWGWAMRICMLLLIVSMCMFFAMTKHYRYRKSQGSPLPQIAHVLITAFKRRNMETTDDFYEKNDVTYSNRQLPHTDQFRFLDRAALKQEDGKEPCCTSTQVEEVKLVLRVIPIWIVVLWLGIVSSQVGTFFVTQGRYMERHMGNFSIPSASMSLFAFITSIIFLPIYDKWVVPFLRRHTKNERGFSLLQRIGIGFVLCMLDMMVAAVVEMKRKRVSGKLSIFWLVPQYGLYGLLQSVSYPALMEFFDEQTPDSMQSLGVSMAFLVTNGFASFLSSAIVSMIDKANPTWLQNDINKGHLDCYYWVLVLVSAINLLIYLPLALSYAYKKTNKSAASLTLICEPLLA